MGNPGSNAAVYTLLANSLHIRIINNPQISQLNKTNLSSVVIGKPLMHHYGW
jgi:hypothetical protein